jgi:chromosome segregation ATPase
MKLPEPYGSKLYPHVQNVYVGWTAYSAAVKEKSNHVIQEIWQIRKGPRGKELHELQREYRVLQNQRRSLLNRLKRKRHRDEAANRQLKSIDAAISRIRRKVEKDYGVLLS